MLNMFSSYMQAVKKSLVAETVSMNMVMTGMLPVVLVLRTIYPEARDPGGIYSWGVMSLATIVGFIIGHPINSWLVKRGVKHGMMSRSMDHHHHMTAQSLSVGLILWTVLWTYAVLVIVIWICSWFVPVSFG